MFFRRIPTKSVSRQRLKYLLLLSLRVLVILLIVLAFARPFFPGAARALFAGTEGKHAVILLDTSMSMQYGDRWERALAAAGEVIDDLGERDQGQIVTFSSDFQILNLPTSDKAVLRAVLESGPGPTASTTSYAQAFRAAERIAEDARQPLSVVLISDLQQSGLGSQPQGLPVPPAEQFRWVDVSQGESPNWRVEGVRSRRTLYQARYPERLVAQVRGFQTPETSKDLTLFLGEKLIERKKVQVPASGAATVVLEAFDVPPGRHRAEIRLQPPDGLALDDSFYFTVERREPYRILFLREPAEEAELYYFQRALAAEPDSPFVVQARTPAEVSTLRLRDYPMVVLSNVARLPRELASQLTRFVREGGGLLITLGNRFPAPSLETELQEIWPAPSIEKQWMMGDAGRLVLLGEFDKEHPAFREFGITGADSLRSAETYAYVRLQPEGGVLLRYANGDPALIEKQFGQGRVLLFASSWDNVWSDLPLHPAFVPLVHQLVRYTLQLPEEPSAYTIPGTVSLESYKTGGGEDASSRIWDVIGPDGQREVPLAEHMRPDFLLLRRPGFYQVRSQQEAHLIAANSHPQESDLAKISLEDQALWRSSFQARREAGTLAASLDLAKRQTIWWNLLVVALLLALAEAYLANQYLKPQMAVVASGRPQEEAGSDVR